MLADALLASIAMLIASYFGAPDIEEATPALGAATFLSFLLRAPPYAMICTRSFFDDARRHASISLLRAIYLRP